MPTISSGVDTINIPQGETLVGHSTGECYVTITGGSEIRMVGGTRRFGSTSNAQELTVEIISGEFDYSVGTTVAPEVFGANAVFNEGRTALLDAESGEVIMRPIIAYTWATKPTAAGNTGLTIRATDVGLGAGSLFMSDGTNWRPVNGSVVIDRQCGNAASPVASQSNGEFGLIDVGRDIVIPANMLIPGESRVEVKALVKRQAGSTTGANFNITIGTGASGNQNVFAAGMGTTANGLMQPDPIISLVATGEFITSAWMQTGGATVSASLAGGTTNVDSTSDMYVGFDFSNKQTGDEFAILDYEVIVHG